MRPASPEAATAPLGTLEAIASPLETERLRLRPYSDDDFEALFAMRSSPEVARYLYWEPQSEDEVRKNLARKIASTSVTADGDGLAFAAELRATGELVVDVSLQLVSREHGVGEIGYIVSPEHAGRGFATEATRPVLAIAFDDLGLRRLIGRLDARNTASARVLEKLGMRLEAHFVENELVKGELQSELVYALLEREWRVKRSP